MSVVNELKEIIETTECKAISPEQMAGLKLCALCDLVLSYSPGKELFKKELDKILDAGPPYTSKQLENALIEVAKIKEVKNG